LTARTHYTGVTRKRVLPVALNSVLDGTSNETKLFPAFLEQPGSLPPAETVVTNAAGEPSGKIVTSLLNIGLVVLRMEHTEKNVTDTVLKADGTELRVLKPAWWESYEKSANK
jgi:folate-binding Fe-S cluster repair protein YgfZ